MRTAGWLGANKDHDMAEQIRLIGITSAAAFSFAAARADFQAY
jgi:hypothetical protein